MYGERNVVGFADIARLALQPGALSLNPVFGRAMFVRDLDRAQRQGFGREEARLMEDRHEFDVALRDQAMTAARQGRTLTERERRYRPSGNPNQYMLDAIQRDAALAEYDRQAPALRAERAADVGRR